MSTLSTLLRASQWPDSPNELLRDLVLPIEVLRDQIQLKELLHYPTLPSTGKLLFELVLSGKLLHDTFLAGKLLHDYSTCQAYGVVLPGEIPHDPIIHGKILHDL